MNLRAACSLGILGLSLGGFALAQAGASISGTVVSSSANSLVIRTDSGAEQSFDVDTGTTLPAGLMAGDRVTVNHHVLDTGRRHVASVTLGDTSIAPAEPTNGELPDTASELPLLALAGVMTIAAGLVLRELRRREA